MQTAFEGFAQLLNERLSADTFTTEDSARYTFILALVLNHFCSPTEILLELPHSKIPRAEIDLFISSRCERPERPAG